MAKRAPLGVVTKVTCRSCGEPRPLDDYRLYQTSPSKVYMDFCVHCEKQHGTLVLYRRFNAYGTKEVVDEVFRCSRIPQAKRTFEQARLLVEPEQEREPETNETLVQRELERRELARRRLIYFVSTMKKDYMPGWVHQDICRRLERFVKQVEAGESPRLMLFLPPRVGKSELASDQFPSWVLGKHPDWGIISTSYAQTLPIKFSRNIRTRLKSPEYQAIFPTTRLREDSQGVEEWNTSVNGGFKAAGIGSGITGFGGHILIVDDPVKDDEEARSEVIRENTYNWYQSTFKTRLAPGGGILVIQTRWHFDDLSGRLLADESELVKAGVPEYERDNWEVVEYAALAESDEYLMRDGSIYKGELDDTETALRLLRRKGEAVHPERYPTAAMRRLKNTLPSSTWNALYQQKPTPDEGDYFLKDDMRYRWLDPAYRPLCRTFMTVDYAIGKKERNDFTVMGVFALDSEDNLYLIDVRRGRWGTDDIVSNAVALIEKHKPEVYAGEQGAIHMAVWPVIQKELDTRRLYISIDESLTPITDKETRARPLQGRMQRHKLFFSYDEAVRPDIYDAVETEMLQFPNGKNDDIVDMLAWGGRLALNTALPNAQKLPARPAGWKDRLANLAGNNNRHFMAG